MTTAIEFLIVVSVSSNNKEKRGREGVRKEVSDNAEHGMDGLEYPVASS